MATEKWLSSVAKSGDYNDLTNRPTSLPANGGNATTVSGRTVDDSVSTANNLWTANKTKTLLDQKSDKLHSHGDATTSNSGFLSATDKTKLDSIANGANNYTHPSTHPATIIAQDTTHRFITDSERNAWNAKASTSIASPSTNGLMSNADKSKLDGIANGANNYTHPSTHPATMITQDTTHRFVSDSQISLWGNKYTKTEVDNKIAQVISNMDWKQSVPTYSDIPKTYPTPKDGWTVNVDDTDITYRYTGTEWIPISANSIPMATGSVDGKMSKADKSKLDGIANNANNYTHPSTHPATMITQDGTHRFITDSERNAWNAKASTSIASSSSNGLMSNADKSKLDGIASGANKYTHPTTTKQATNSSANVNVGATFTAVDSISTNAEGHVTAVNTKTVKILSTDNPVGSLLWHFGKTVPSKYLICDGAAVSRTTYGDLFKVIGTTYGGGDGTNTFNLPNLTANQRFVRAASSTTGVGTVQSESLADVRTAYEGEFNADKLYPVGAKCFSTATTAEVRPVNMALLPCIRVYY